MPEFTISIAPDGAVRHIADPALAFLAREGQRVQRTRVSHVMPANRWKRVAFVLIRSLFSDDSRAAGWTRTWRGPWQADMSPFGLEGHGVVLGPYVERFAAIAAERRWLEERL